MILSTLHQVYPLKYYLQWHSTRHQNVHRTVTISSRIRRQSNIRKNYLTCLHFKKKISGDWVGMWRQSNSKEDTLFYCPHLQNFSLLLEKVVESTWLWSISYNILPKTYFIWVNYSVRAHFKYSFKYKTNICTDICFKSYT